MKSVTTKDFALDFEVTQYYIVYHNRLRFFMLHSSYFQETIHFAENH